MNNDHVTITITLEPETAYQFAQFLKRTTFNDCYAHTEPHLPNDERKDIAYRMIDGVEATRHVLAEAGIAPR